MVQTNAKAVAVGEAAAETVGVADEGAAIVTVGFLVSILRYVYVGTGIHVVGTQLHLVVKEVPVAVDTGVPGSGDAVAATEPAAESAAAAHHAASSHHAAHHVAHKVREAAVVGVVGTGDDAELGTFREAAHHEVALEAPVIHGLCAGGNVVASAGLQVSEDAVHHAALDAEVDDGLVVTVVNAGELGLLALFLHHLHFLDKLGGDVLGSQLRVVHEEGLAVNHDFVDGFSVGGDIAALVHFHAGKLLQEVFQHVVVGDLEGRGIVLHGVLLDDDGITHGADRCGVQHFLVQGHLDGAEVGIGLYLHHLLAGLVAQDFRLDGVLAGTYLFQDGLTLGVGEGVLGLPFFRGGRYRGKPYGLAVRCIL